MKWSESSEVVAGLAIMGRISTNCLRPELFIEPYNEMVKLLKEGADREDLILKVGSEPVQVAIHAQDNINGLSSSNWIKMLETSYVLHSTGQQLEKLGKDMQRAKEPDPAKLAYITKQFQTGQTGRVPLSQIKSRFRFKV